MKSKTQKPKEIHEKNGKRKEKQKKLQFITVHQWSFLLLLLLLLLFLQDQQMIEEHHEDVSGPRLVGEFVGCAR